jgi:hypothetical protein
MNKKFTNYEYRGYRYDPYEEIEYGDEGPENVKIFHYVNTPANEQISFDWSPYSVPSFDEFALWIELGCPDRITGGPLDAKDLQAILNERDEVLRAWQG